MNWVYGKEDVAFTADTHFGHGNIIKYCNRPFANVDDMNVCMANNINLLLKKGGFLYHLGDWSFGAGKRFREMIRPDINVVLIFGNHDVKQRKDHRFTSLFHSVFDLLERKIYDQRIVMCHYAMRTWNRQHYGTWSIFGHSHGTLPDDPNSRSFDVGVDCHGYAPLTFQQVETIISRKTWKPIDHHKGL
jgi:calcineurin-like phosphoesterase family protein